MKEPPLIEGSGSDEVSQLALELASPQLSLAPPPPEPPPPNPVQLDPPSPLLLPEPGSNEIPLELELECELRFGDRVDREFRARGLI
ncbi:MAG TPA: hypothetical protein VGB07_10755, partial [Blastocatellia bacterium]